jgi:hypothetical protein
VATRRITLSTLTVAVSLAIASALLLGVQAAPSASASRPHLSPSSVQPPAGSWVQQPVVGPTAPPTTYGISMGVFGYDSVTGHYLFMGGPNGTDLWSFDPAANTWQAITPIGAPPALFFAGNHVAWDPVGRRFIAVIFIVDELSPPSTHVSTYDVATNTWSTVLATSGPTALAGQGVVWDTFAHRLLVFGGCYGVDSCTATNALWSYDPASTAWTLISSSGPSPRTDATTVWDSTDNQLLVFGGRTASQLVMSDLNDTWSWDSLTQSWAQLAVTNAAGGALPQTRSGASGVWDPVHRQLLVFGGSHLDFGVSDNDLDELWALRPAAHAWARLPDGPPTPPASSYDAAVWDPTLASMRLLTPNAASPPPTSMWAYQPAAPVPGGRSFTLQLATDGVHLSWQTGDDQSGYRVVRQTGSATTIVGSTLPADATSAIDPGPPALACYRLATMGGSAILVTSPQLCTLTLVAPAPGDPRNLSISVNDLGQIVLSWSAPVTPAPGFTGYVVARADSNYLAFPGTATSYTTDSAMTRSTCWSVQARSKSVITGRSSVVCALVQPSS